MAKVHMPAPAIAGESYREGFGRSFCGRFDVVIASADVVGVTCKRCLIGMGKLPPPEAPFEPGPEVKARYGRADLDDVGSALIEKSIRGHEEQRYPWRSAQDALESLFSFQRDGQGIGSSSNPARFEKAPRGRTDPTRQVTAMVDRHHGIGRAFLAAFTEPREFTWYRCACGAEHGHRNACANPSAVSVEVATLTVDDQRMILRWAMSRRIMRGGGGFEAVSMNADSVLMRAESRGLALAERHVEAVIRSGLAAVRAHLRAIGELPPASPRESERSEAMQGYDLSGWDEIEAHTKLSRAVMRRLSKREDDPLPIYVFDGVRGHYAKSDELTAWFERNAKLRSAGAA